MPFAVARTSFIETGGQLELVYGTPRMNSRGKTVKKKKKKERKQRKEKKKENRGGKNIESTTGDSYFIRNGLSSPSGEAMKNSIGSV